jgi:hypothetical protein
MKKIIPQNFSLLSPVSLTPAIKSFGPKGGTHSLGGEGAGEANWDEGTDTLLGLRLATTTILRKCRASGSLLGSQRQR